MSEKEKDILDALKNQLIRTTCVNEEDFFEINEDSKTQNCIYYLRNYQDNLLACTNHKEEYKKGGGRELFKNNWDVIPMASLRSSAALTWNIFGDEATCHIDNAWNLSAGEYKLKYEWNESETILGHYANLDARLHCDNFYLFVETKMMEPLTRTHPFKSIDKYLVEGVCPKEFRNAIIDFQTKEPEFFDAFQMIKHLLAIYNYFRKMESTSRKKVVLLNCHWEPSEDYKNGHNSYSNRTISLKDTYKRFKDTADRFNRMKKGFIPLFDIIGVDLELATCDHRELIKIVGKEDDKYLKRYDI